MHFLKCCSYLALKIRRDLKGSKIYFSRNIGRKIKVKKNHKMWSWYSVRGNSDYEHKKKLRLQIPSLVQFLILRCAIRLPQFPSLAVRVYSIICRTERSSKGALKQIGHTRPWDQMGCIQESWGSWPLSLQFHSL